MSNSKFSETEFQFGKSIFDYVLDNSMYINKMECNDYTPPFISYMPGGIANIDAENELKGMNSKTYKTPNPSLANSSNEFFIGRIKGTLPSKDVFDKGTLPSKDVFDIKKKECYIKRI